MQAEIRESGKKVKTVSWYILMIVSFVAARAVWGREGSGRRRRIMESKFTFLDPRVKIL